MKIVKIIAINLIAVFFLFFLLEAGCRMTSDQPFSFAKAIALNPVVINRTLLIKEFGEYVFATPPATHQSHFNFDGLKGFSTADIDHVVPAQRQWIVSPDGEYRSSRFIEKIKNSDTSIFDVTYKVTPYERRYVENQKHKTTADHFVLAAGDSFTFGVGVDQGQDYPSTLASLIGPKWKVYNFGIPGDSANDFYYRNYLNPDFLSPIQEKDGVFIWLYHDIQMQRLIYPTTAYKTATYISTKPEFTLTSDEELIFHGFFKDSNRPLRVIANSMSGLAITKKFNLEIPKVFTENHFNLFFKLLNNSLLHLEENGRHVNKKILIIYKSRYNSELLKAVAEKNGFIILDAEKFLNARDKLYGGDLNLFIPIDTHPTPEAYWLLSTALKNKFFN